VPHSEQIHVDVYTVSYCDQADPVCGPGHNGERGIRPRLCFYFTGSDGIAPDWNDHFCVSQYDAFAWAESQPTSTECALTQTRHRDASAGWLVSE
jgi:hypothetical protein